MKLELYFAPGACSFVPHVALEAIKAASGQEFEPKIVKLHKGEQKSPEYLAINPNGQVPVLVVDGAPLSQIVAICEFLDRSFPAARLLPTQSWARARALSQLAWMNNTVHPTFTQIFRTGDFVDGEAPLAELKRNAVARFRGHLERLQGLAEKASPYWLGAHLSFHDAYAFTFLRWGGIAGIDPEGFPLLKRYVEGVMRAAPVAAALARERIRLDTYKAG